MNAKSSTTIASLFHGGDLWKNILLNLSSLYTKKKLSQMSFSSPFPLFDNLKFENEVTSSVRGLLFPSRPSVILQHACVISFVDETDVA